ncbi:MAG: helix-turn-helix domain-containing protein [Propionicimonas sp.]|uniref:helix-turn-helix transcriptional regulator n=1 Tax=Propionicimonas sp. TaxID=1955623 RepID=UPI002B21E46D|nr:helix-turn-helix domain-containing protein [Propionicimonas sp.]MEA4944534.1 helix-turn-helix domain-containing protein [Propionicimonas sp.]MEA5119640.1 helix-turn-helix domain-containing protein [Propionicimonas sp.]
MNGQDLELLDVAGIVAATGLAARTVRELVYTRQLPVVKVGSRAYVRRSDLADWIERNTEPARAEQ